MPKATPPAEWPHVSDAVMVRQDDGSYVYLSRPDAAGDDSTDDKESR